MCFDLSNFQPFGHVCLTLIFFNKGENSSDLCFINVHVSKVNTKIGAENKDKKDMRTRYSICGFAA